MVPAGEGATGEEAEDTEVVIEAGEVTGETGVEAEIIPFLYNIGLGPPILGEKSSMAACA